MTENQLLYFVDDDPLANRLFQRVCKQIGYPCQVFVSAQACLERIHQRPPAVVLTDLNMPGMDGFELIQTLAIHRPSLPVVAITGQSTVERAVQAMRTGASDFLKKPYEVAELQMVIQRALRFSALNEENQRLKRQIKQPQEALGMLGRSAQMLRVHKLIDKLAVVDCPVVIAGESGVGKELAAKAIHARGPRSAEPYIVIDCGALPDALLESELFGHAKGAFTGADRRRIGLLEAAAGGTVFLDEIGNISGAMQAKLLRVCQERKVTPLGAHAQVPIRARFLAASNQDLGRLVEQGRFRHDLYHRLNVVTLTIPSLAQRREDIPVLIEHFAGQYAQRYGRPLRRFSAAMMRRLCERQWPGNIRELRNFVERCVIMADGESLDSGADGPLEAHQNGRGTSPEGSGRPQTLEEMERCYIREVLDSVGGSQVQAARILGINRTTLWRKLHPR